MKIFWDTLTGAGKMVILVLVMMVGVLTLALVSRPTTPEWVSSEIYVPCPTCGRPVQWIGFNSRGKEGAVDIRKANTILLIGACAAGHVCTFDNAATKIAKK